jgi:hypothetical protein
MAAQPARTSSAAPVADAYRVLRIPRSLSA